MCKRTEKTWLNRQERKYRKATKVFYKKAILSEKLKMSQTSIEENMTRGEITKKLGMYENIPRDDEVH
jgi:hypothetical protein